MAKQLTRKDKIILFFTTYLGELFIRLLGFAARIEKGGKENVDFLNAQNVPILYCIWHGRILAPIFIHRNQGVVGMVSQHRDGEIIARIIERLGYKTVRGSSTRGGREAAVNMLNALRSGNHGAIMPDGPTGPRHILKPGVISIAQKSGAWLQPFTYAAAKPITFKSWDRFTIWRPFSKVFALYGEPMKIPTELSDAEFEEFRKDFETRMIKLEEQADAHFRK